MHITFYLKKKWFYNENFIIANPDEREMLLKRSAFCAKIASLYANGVSSAMLIVVIINIFHMIMASSRIMIIELT